LRTLLLEKILPVLDWIGRLLAFISMGLLVAMMAATVYETIARKFFNAPTMWALDVTYMINGSAFLMAAAFALRMNDHVRVDFLSSRLPLRFQHGLNLAFLTLIIIPAIGMMAYVSVYKAWKAFITGEVETMSAWEPLIWPFFTGIALGLASLFLQVVVECIRHIFGLANPGLVRPPSVKPQGKWG
jgi:TRAP-type mannitol/chloroaromatic compound transport system permease small subunit